MKLMEKPKKKITVMVNPNVGNQAYIAYLSTMFDVITVNASEWKGEKLDLLLFTGGEDVNPKYYKEKIGRYTGINAERDQFERDYMFDRFPQVAKLGICRGSQFVTVLSGGKLIQHVNGHATNKLHEIGLKRQYGTNIYNITSTHHQMLFPYNLDKKDYSIIATAKYYLSNTYLNGDNKEIEIPQGFEECEIVFYPNSNSLAIQGHPEMSNCPVETKEFCLSLIERTLKL